MTRSEAIDKLWERVGPTVFISKDDYIEALNGWEITAVEVEEQLAYIKLVRGPELHFESFGGGHVNGTFGMIYDGIEPVLKEHGYVKTRTPKEETRQHRFNRAIGFEPDGEDEFYIYWRLEKLRRERRV